MKNFSAKTADFDSISISGEAPIVQSDLGTAPNQIPLNKDLGTLAYMDSSGVEDVNADTIELREIAAELSETAVDVFVYDTRKDSDGGAWRSRTSHTSWYNEELNTATRGGRREFPAVAVIVADNSSEEFPTVSIYDGDDPDLPMWIVFHSRNTNCLLGNGGNYSSIYMQNGMLCAGRVSGSKGLSYCNFITEKTVSIQRSESQYKYTYLGDISERNTGSGYTSSGDSADALAGDEINDVAMTVLPNAPIDDDTGLPIPTIAVATDRGVSVIKDDGSVVDKATTSAAVNQVQWMGSGRLVASAPSYYGVFDNPFVEESAAFLGYISDNVYNADPDKNNIYQVPNIMTQLDGSSKLLTLDARTIITSTSAGLNVHEMGEGAAANNNHGIANYITSEYNTGWMPGDIKLATLSDTKVEKVGVDESELVSNGTFGSNTNDWSSTNSSTLSVDNQRLKIQGVGSSYPNAYISVNIVEGVEYEVSAEYISNSNSFSGRIRVSSSSPLGADIVNGDIKSPGTNHIYRFTAPSTGSVYVALMLQDVSGNSSGIWDNISVKQTGELITNGTFDNGIEGWIDQSAGTQSVDSSNVSAGELTLTRLNSDAEQITQLLNLVEGKRYVLSFDVTASINDKGEIWVGTDLPVNNQVLGDGTQTAKSTLETGNILGVGSYSYTFTAGSTNYLTIRVGANDTISWDNISVRLAEPDRSVNDNGLQIFGEIDKTPVAPGADLVAYSGFSAENYLMQPYNSDLDFGTGDFSIMGWVKPTETPSNHETIIECGEYASPVFVDGTFHLYINSSGSLSMSISNNGYSTLDALHSVQNIRNNTWTQIVVVKSQSGLECYINGKFDNSITFSDFGGTLNFSNFKTIVGSRQQKALSMNSSSLSLLRISATAPTPDQIAKIYRDEKVLFQDGAQATLYGTSDAVTALAYDDKTELLHVGTSDGRSDFAGLRRINNTTTAVTTSISASNNLIAEQ